MPKVRWEVGLGKKGTEHVVNCPDFTFRLTVLGGGVGARETEVQAIGFAKC